MIDQNRIEQIRSMPEKEAKAALKSYAKELGVSTRAKTIDNMVSEIGAQLAEKKLSTQQSAYTFNIPSARAKGVKISPETVNPVTGRGFMFYAKLTDIDNVDTCTFQWKKKTGAGADYTDIAGATSQVYSVEKSSDSDLGEYKCVVTESDGTTTESSEAQVLTLTKLPAGFPEHTFYNATWNEFYGRSYAHVGWHGLYKMYDVLEDDDKNDSPSNVHKAMADYQECIPLIDILSKTNQLVATDSLNGYQHILSSDNFKDNMPTIVGRFVA